jgi:outer membrane protein assembly complex protein YaeT
MRRIAPLLLILAISACSSETVVVPSNPDDVVVFEGASAVSVSELLELTAQDLKRYEEDPRRPALEDAAYRIEYRYRLDGYDRVVVTPRSEANRIVFHIVEGPRVLLAQVHFDGATVFRVEDLKALAPGRFLGNLPPFSARSLILLEDSLIGAYREKGYVDVAVTHRLAVQEGHADRIVVWFMIDEGKPYVVAEIRGLPSNAGLAERTGDFLGRPYASDTGENLEATIVDYYRDHGHPFATARVKPRLDRTTGTAILEVEIREGLQVIVEELKISGTVWTRSSFIRDRADLEAGREYKSSDLHRAEDRLMATNIFRRVRVSPSITQQEAATVPIEIDVEERESGEASVRAGYGSFEGLRVGADLTGHNIWGGAESLRVGGNFSKVGYRGETELGVPYLGGTDVRLGLSGYYENREYPSFDALSRGVVLGFSYPVLEALSATLGLRYANIITSNVDPSVPPGDLLDFKYTAVFFSPTLDLRDSPLNPTRGMLLAGEVSWSPSYLLSDVEFWSAVGRFSYFFPFPGGLVSATSFQGGVIAPIGGTNEIPIALREFCGGTNTVRGYKFEAIGPKANGEPTGGEVFLALQTELRFPIAGDLQGTVFFDEGGVWFDRVRVHLPDLRYAVGLGLRFVTPAGALSADVGWNPHPRQGEYPIEFHLSVGFPF